MEPGRDRLPATAVAAVLRRAAALEGTASTDTQDLPFELVEDAAVEAGIERWAVRQALAEWQAGTLDAPVATAVVTVTRVLPLPPGEVEAALADLFRRQLLTATRRRPGLQRWRRRDDRLASLRRRLDWRGRLRFERVAEVVVRTAPADGGTLARLDATLRTPLRVPTATCAGGVAGVGAATCVVGLVTGSLATAVALAALPVGALAAGGVVLRARVVRQRDLATVADALEACLDDVEARVVTDGRQPRWAAPALG